MTSSIQSLDGNEIAFESLFHVTFKGHIQGALPLLGMGHHYFKAVKLPANKTLADKYPELPCKNEGWYVYCHDGLGALVCLRLAA